MVSRRQFLLLGGAALLGLTAAAFRRVLEAQTAAQITGQVLASGSGPQPGARVTLFSADLSFFRAARTDPLGQYTFDAVAAGSYQLGTCAPGREYQEVTIVVGPGGASKNFTLAADTHPGAWAVIGSTAPETFGGTNSGTVLPDGRIFYCHDATDPIIFNPATGIATPGAASPSEQGCHMPTLLADGRLLLVGGGTIDDAGNFTGSESALDTVKAYDSVTNTWEVWPSLNERRWYPGLARLADGQLLLFGGGQQPTLGRTATSEILDPATRVSTPTGAMIKAGGFGPAMLLYTGEVLCTWEPPMLYNLESGEWRATGPFVQPNRATIESCPSGSKPAGQVPPAGDHPDHTAIMLTDGSVLAIGIRRTALGNPGAMVEAYDPVQKSWSLRSNPATLRSMAKVLMLPTGQILVAGGKREDPQSSDMVNPWCQLKRADLYDPEADSWRQVADMGDYREYHAIMLLIPDGRVLITAGTNAPGSNPPSNANKNIEAFSPPYLFRGVRPQIDRLSTTRLSAGDTFTMAVSRTNAISSLVLIGMNAQSHWMEGGVPRLLRLSFSQAGSIVTAKLPADERVAPVGHYLLFAFVDDIPSEGKVVTIEPYEVHLPLVTHE